MNSDFNITVNIDLQMLKMIEEGSYLDSENKAFEHGKSIEFVRSNNWNAFLRNAVTDYYDQVKKQNLAYKVNLR